MELKKETQEFLEGLDEKQINEIKKALKTYDTIETLGWFFKWLAISGLAVLVFLTQVKEQLKILFSLKGG